MNKVVEGDFKAYQEFVVAQFVESVFGLRKIAVKSGPIPDYINEWLNKIKVKNPDNLRTYYFNVITRYGDLGILSGPMPLLDISKTSIDAQYFGYPSTAPSWCLRLTDPKEVFEKFIKEFVPRIRV